MEFFKPFRIIDGYQIDNKKVVGLDITRRRRIPSELKEDSSFYIEYQVQNGETPEILADRIYDNVNEYWIICEFNNIVDIENDWPMEQSALDAFVLKKYGNPYGIHHYVSSATGAIVSSDWDLYDRVIVTNYEHEVALNDKKRNIKIPLPENKGILISLHRGI